MHQDYSTYTDQNQDTWKQLFLRQKANLQDKASKRYLECLDELAPCLHENKIPDFREMNLILQARTGWRIVVVPGLIPVSRFFELLANREFCSSTWIRKPEEMDYLEEPDMFHDIFGHIPLLMDKPYADFMQAFGQMGLRYIGNEQAIQQLERLYWFTIEFGMIFESGKKKIYGAGIASSFGESKKVIEEEVPLIPFDIKTLMAQDFRTDVMQSVYFSLDSYQQLWDCLDQIPSILGPDTPGSKLVA